MTRQYRDPRTGFFITTGEDPWTNLPYVPPEPPSTDLSEDAPQQPNGPDMNMLADFNYWRAHKKEIWAAAQSQNQPTPTN